jgi:glycerol kinase
MSGLDTANSYIVVLDVAQSVVRALLFDSKARRVEGYSAQLPERPDAAADCLDEMHRLVHAAGFGVAAVVGRAETEVTAEDRSCWPGFGEALWFPSLAEGAGIVMGSGCVSRQRVALVLADASMVATVIGSQVSGEGLTCVQIDEKRWLLSGAVPEAEVAYAAFKQSIKGSVEKYLENAAADDPLLTELDLGMRRFREVYEKLAGHGPAPQVIACGGALLKAPALAQRIANAMGVSLTLSTESEPECRGAALWALERVGAIGDLEAHAASMGPMFHPEEGRSGTSGTCPTAAQAKLETTK